jgi:hypothetical protein
MPQLMRIAFFFLLLMGTQVVCVAQDDDDWEEEDEWDDEDEGKGFGISLNIGAYFANKTTANLYNGACGFEVVDDPSGVRCYDIFTRLTLNINDISFINNYYGSTSFEAPFDMHPLNMRYNPSFMYGLNIKYYFNWLEAITVDFNSVQLKTVDQFTLRFIGTTQQVNSQSDTRLFTISGEETRFQFKLGYQHGWEMNSTSQFYMDFGGSMVGAKLESNTVRVADRDYQLILGAQNPQQIINFQPKTQVGFGWFIGGGASVAFENKVNMDIGAYLSRDRVRLENYDGKLMNWAVYTRFGI